MGVSLRNAQMPQVFDRNMSGIVICHCFMKLNVLIAGSRYKGNQNIVVCGCISKTSINQAKACFRFTENPLLKSVAIKNMVIFWLSQEPVQLFRPS